MIYSQKTTSNLEHIDNLEIDRQTKELFIQKQNKMSAQLVARWRTENGKLVRRWVVM